MLKAGQQIVQRVTLRAPHRFWRAQLQHLAPRAHNTPAKAQRVWKRATPLIYTASSSIMAEALAAAPAPAAAPANTKDTLLENIKA